MSLKLWYNGQPEEFLTWTPLFNIGIVSRNILILVLADDSPEILVISPIPLSNLFADSAAFSSLESSSSSWFSPETPKDSSILSILEEFSTNLETSVTLPSLSFITSSLNFSVDLMFTPLALRNFFTSSENSTKFNTVCLAIAAVISSFSNLLSNSGEGFLAFSFLRSSILIEDSSIFARVVW